MNKTEFTEALKERCSNDFETKAAAARVTDAVFDIIKDEVINGGSVQIVGFGTFDSADRAARTGKNPQTGESIQIPAKKVPIFKAGKTFKDAVNQ